MQMYNYKLSHADRNLIVEVLEANQTNCMPIAKRLRHTLDSTIGVHMASYEVSLEIETVKWLRRQLMDFAAHSHDKVLKHLSKDLLPALLTNLANGTPVTPHHQPHFSANNTSSWWSGNIFSSAFTSAFLVTAAACLVLWAVIEGVSYFSK